MVSTSRGHKPCFKRVIRPLPIDTKVLDGAKWLQLGGGEDITLSVFSHGFLLALVLILPLGPQNMFVFTQGATQRRFMLVAPVILTAALSDTMLIVGAVAGISVVVLTMPALKMLLGIAGILFLLWMGYKTWTARVESSVLGLDNADWSTKKKIHYSLSVSLLNPHAILDTVVIIGGGAAFYSTAEERAVYAFGAVLVSWAWFLALATAGYLFQRGRRRTSTLRWINRGSALVMWAVAIRYLLNLLQGSAS